MPGTKGRAARAITLVALLILLGVALRARVPGAQGPDRAQPQPNAATFLGVIALVSAALLVVTVAVVMSLREPRRALPTPRYDVPGGGGVRGRRSWRLLLIGLAGIATWLVIVVLLAQLRLPQYRDEPVPAPAPRPDPGGPSPQRPPTSPPGGADDHVLWVLVASTTALTLLIVTATLLVRRRRRRDGAVGAVPAGDVEIAASRSGPESLALAAERGLAQVGDLSREPRDAIIACYAAMENALASAPGAAPQESDTPSEVLARAVEHHAIHAGSAAELVALFAEARFSTHVMNEGHRDAAERALRLVLDELRSAV